MIVVKVKSQDHAFAIPVPYVVLRLGSGILTSGLFRRKMRGWLNMDGMHAGDESSLAPNFGSVGSRFGKELLLSIVENRSTKQALRQLINELQRCKGTVLVDVQAGDGTKVWIRL
ncbi:hypothetical protein [Paenibacillus sacheonensis]|uniref:Uncharacterized protein n=1 Tax=Paenibacillus sacheonensis TaxID=742054 RepID=A0A7X4YSQ5_9BACL|nr:hypothetical protein [Paenibacillus sacheonensis]MBM7567149.1 hypothetical protein [Paenibacillus sacheonensis]NBC70926.1 hypothetical protein [Paenibacillus sacheonensis]